MARQLAFDLPVKTALGREDYFVSPANALAVAALEDWRRWPGAMMMLVGAKGSGKTHLAHVWAADVGARFLTADDLRAEDVIDAISAQPVIIEDIDGPDLSEEALFHAYNIARSSGQPSLMTASVHPAHHPFALPDLASRLRSVPLTELSAPDDQLLQAVMLKQFADRQLAVPPSLLPYLLGRMERSFAAAQAMVATLDRAALAEGRAVTRALAARVLDKTGPSGA